MALQEIIISNDTRCARREEDSRLHRSDVPSNRSAEKKHPDVALRPRPSGQTKPFLHNMASSEGGHPAAEAADSTQATPSCLSPRLSPSELRDETSKMSSGGEEHLAADVPFVPKPSESLSTSFPLSPPEGQQETPGASVGDEQTPMRPPSLLPTSTLMSPLSSSAGIAPDAGQTMTTTAGGATTTAAAASTTAGPSSPLDHVLIIGHGRFQKMVLVCTTLAFFTTIVHALASTSLARPVDHWCRSCRSPPEEYAFVSADTWKNVGIPVHRDGSRVRRSQCHRYEPPFESPVAESDLVSALLDNRSVIPCDAGWRYEGGGVSGASHVRHSGFGELDLKYPHSIVDDWDLVCNRSWIVSALTAVYMAGGVVGAPVAGIATDRIGRRPVLCTWLLLLFFAGTALVFAHNVPVFAVLRFLLSAGAAGVLVASHVLLFEVTGSQYRATYCAIAVAGATCAAAVYSELIYVCIRNWHAAQVAYMIPSCGMIVAVYLMEESPCWLLAVSEMRYAESVLVWAASVNKIEPRLFKRRLFLLRTELSRQHEQMAVQQEPESAIVSDHEVRVSDLLSNHTLRQRSLLIFGCWFLVFGTFSHLTTASVMRTSETARIVLVFLRLPCVVADVYTIARFGRRLAPDTLVAVFVVAGLLVFDMSAITVFSFSAELYPTVLRGAALGCCYMSGRLGAFVAPFVNEIRSAPIRSFAHAISAAMLLLLSTMALALPETKELPPSNTVQGMMAMEDKWLLYSPLRVARSGGKRRRSRMASLERLNKRSRGGSLSSARQLNRLCTPAAF
ncbi:hypothetical protein HPB50_018096 [Hyalomma asiaticum]|uniref:Uncharacterized protein n=1 Tax=Hyalomma asiaticum TaxID=266040 RepID=A0ACB7RY48_HYAAI|nr:hypothetical protein HPB50_018096 [Hyalomma asiaticum]